MHKECGMGQSTRPCVLVGITTSTIWWYILGQMRLMDNFYMLENLKVWIRPPKEARHAIGTYLGRFVTTSCDMDDIFITTNVHLSLRQMCKPFYLGRAVGKPWSWPNYQLVVLLNNVFSKLWRIRSLHHLAQKPYQTCKREWVKEHDLNTWLMCCLTTFDHSFVIRIPPCFAFTTWTYLCTRSRFVVRNLRW